MNSIRSRIPRLARRFLLRILSPAVIGSLSGFAATSAMQYWQAKQTADYAFNDSQRLKDDERIDNIRTKITNAPKDRCVDIGNRITLAKQESETLRTVYGRDQLVPIIHRLEEDQSVCTVLTKINGMPNVTSADVENRISELQGSLEKFATDYGRNQLYTVLESLRGSRNAKREAEKLDEERRLNEEKARREAGDAAIKKAAEDAASAAAAAAVAARREATMFERGLDYRGVGRERIH